MKPAKIFGAVVLLVVATAYVAGERSEARDAEAAAERFFAAPGFSRDYSSDTAPEWRAVEDRRASDARRTLLVHKAEP
jgi:hypothetical protein